MSWRATAWAKDTRGHRSPSMKLILMILADYYQDEEAAAWPSQARLSDDCEIPIRTIQRGLKQLEQAGFITTVRKGNQHKPSRYALNFSQVMADAPIGEPAITDEIDELEALEVADAPESEPAKSEPANMAGSDTDESEPAILSTVNPPFEASEPAISLHANKVLTDKEQTIEHTERPKSNSWRYPAWWEPMIDLEGYEDRRYQGSVDAIRTACENAQIHPADLIKQFCEDWPRLRLPKAQGGYGKRNPVNTLTRNLDIQIRKARNGQRPNGRARRNHSDPNKYIQESVRRGGRDQAGRIA